MRPLRIGVNALYMIPGQVGGTEIYLRNLLRALAELDLVNEYFVFTNEETGPDLINTDRFHTRLQELRASNRPMRLIWEQTQLPMQAHELRLDCMLNPGFTAPLTTACPNVTVFHDLQHKRHPEYFRWFDLPAWNFFLWASAKRSRILIADSEASADDLVRFYAIPPGRIRCVHLGVEDEFFRIASRRTRPEPFLLCTSTIHPHKNLDRLVRAFAQFRASRPEFRLVITGVRGFSAGDVEKLVADLQCEDAVDLTGWLPRSDLYNLFEHAHGFIYPSIFEGFGLPVVEAMAAGIPLACSDIEPLRTLAGDAALRFDPARTEEIVSAMERLAGDEELRAMLSKAGVERAASFTWEACARGTLAAIQTAIQTAIEAGPRAEP
jgi:glycosyltransferase involved in cell wall biosynthesis